MRELCQGDLRPFTDKEIAEKIAELLRPEGIKSKIEIVYQTVENMHRAIPDHPGDWYFTGDYPTPGGNRLVSQAFVNYYEGMESRRPDSPYPDSKTN